MSTVKIGNKKAFLLSPDTFVDGVFIDKLLESGTLNNGSATYTNWEYTATQDCIVVVNTGKVSNKSITIYIDNKTLINYGTGWTFDSIMTPIQVKKGQTYKILNLGNYANYYVYSIQRGSASENIGTVRELTYAEYNALSESEKMNGTEYYIKDINGDGQAFQPVIYSLDEREIGVWTDGKPLYEKTVVLTNLSSGTDVSAAHEIANIDTVVSYSGGFYSSNDVIEISSVILKDATSSSSYVNGQWTAAIVSVSKTNINYGLGNNVFNRVDNIKLTIRYTKTTDTAGSGTWTPQGVPAHHYLTDEHIVGTWVDGSTLYEKTVEYSCENTSDTQRAYTGNNDDVIVQILDYYFINSQNVQIRSSWSGTHFWDFISGLTTLTVKRNTNDANWQSGVKFIATIQYTKSS